MWVGRRLLVTVVSSVLVSSISFAIIVLTFIFYGREFGRPVSRGRAPYPASLSLVVLREEHGRYRPIRLGDHPELDAVSVVVDREEPKTLLHGELVLLPILGAAFAPIARSM